MLRVLVGVAAIAVIAAVGYYFWRDYSDRLEAERIAAAASQRAMDRSLCMDILGSFNFNAGEKDRNYGTLMDCAERGVLTAADIEAERARS